MTLRQYQIIAACAMLAAFVVLGSAILKQVANDSAARAQVARIDRITDSLNVVKRERTASQAAADTFRRQRDSLLADVRTPRVYPIRQYTTVAVDSTVPPALAATIATLTAERDTARADADSAQADTERMRLTLLTIDSLATQKAISDSVRWTRVVTVVDTVQLELTQLRKEVRPRFWRRAGRVLLRTGELTLQAFGVVKVLEVIT